MSMLEKELWFKNHIMESFKVEDSSNLVNIYIIKTVFFKELLAKHLFELNIF